MGRSRLAPTLLSLSLSSIGLAASSRLQAADYYVDPGSGSDGASGSADDPFATLEAVVASGMFEGGVQPGDRFLLRSGYHGGLVLDGGDFDPPLIIEADVDAVPRLERVRIGSSGVVVRGLSISPSHAPSYETQTIVEVEESASSVSIEDCDIFSEEDASGWSADDWISRASSGVQVSGVDVTIAANRLRNVRFGISADGAGALIVGNTIDGFSADGLRGLGNYEVFESNLVKNVYVDGDLDENHDDGFQSWSVGEDGVGTGEVVGVVLRGNVILNYEDPNQPFRATLQGIGCFDGTFVDWVVENNVVITDHWHGITLLGARNSRIVNNTVLDVNDESPGPPWISIDAHKDGTAPEGCLVRNNIATDYANADSVLFDHNLELTDPFALFVDAENHDLHLLPESEAIDQGTAELAPARDIEQIPRPQGAEVDLGAFEWHEAGVLPEDGALPLPPTPEPADPGPSGPRAGDAGESDPVEPEAAEPSDAEPEAAEPDARPTGGDSPEGPAGAPDGGNAKGAAAESTAGCACGITRRRAADGSLGGFFALGVLSCMVRRMRIRGGRAHTARRSAAFRD